MVFSIFDKSTTQKNNRQLSILPVSHSETTGYACEHIHFVAKITFCCIFYISLEFFAHIG